MIFLNCNKIIREEDGERGRERDYVGLESNQEFVFEREEESLF